VAVRPQRFPGLLFSIVLASFLTMAMSGEAGGAPSSTFAPAANVQTFKVPKSQDAKAPDITSIRVSNNDPGLIRFRVNVANRPQLGADMLFDIFVDADRRASTGSAGLAGVDYVLEVAGGDINLFKWDGSNFTRRGGDPSAASLSYTYRRGLTAQISAADLGNTRGFRFFVSATAGVTVDPDTGDLDFANAHDNTAHPAGGGLYSFDVKRRPVRLAVQNVVATPGKPVAGKPFTVGLTAIRTDTRATLKGGQITCRASAGGRTLPARAPHFVRGAATCTWLVPQSAHGKRLVGSIGIVFEGTTITKSVSFGVG
jgi:hypothetical protein